MVVAAAMWGVVLGIAGGLPEDMTEGSRAPGVGGMVNELVRTPRREMRMDSASDHCSKLRVWTAATVGVVARFVSGEVVYYCYLKSASSQEVK